MTANGIYADFNNKLDEVYYEVLLKQHNYIGHTFREKENLENNIKMEHSYTRDWQPKENMEVMATRTILIDRPPQCPSCHLSPNDDKLDLPDTYSPPVPTYNEDAGRTAMDETERIIRNSSNKNNRSDDEEWEARISKIGWTEQHHTFFRRVERLLDLDQMARLAFQGRTNECLRRRSSVEKSVSRMRQVLASVQWDPKLTQWLHGLLSNHLPPSYMVSYIEILQSLKRKLPTLVDKMLFVRPIDFNTELNNMVMKRAWEPTIAPKARKLPGQSVVVVVPSSPLVSPPSARMQRWLQMLGTLATVIPIQVNISSSAIQKQSLEQVTDQLVAISRAKIQEIRNEVPNRQIVLVGFNAGAAIAVQVALVETVSSIVCLGFSYNTMKGVRGAPDDRILEITTPILFILGQIAQRSSQEEIESLREKMIAQTSLVVVGSADDALRVNKLNRQMEGVTQSMIDSMIVDEIQEFATTCILNPPGPRQPTFNNAVTNGLLGRAVLLSSNANAPPLAKKSRLNAMDGGKMKHQKVGRPRSNRPPNADKPKNPKRLMNTTSEALQMAIDSILPASNLDDNLPPLHPINDATDGSEVISTYEVVASGSGQPNLHALKPINSKLIHGTVGPTSKSQISSSPHNLTQKVKFVPSNQFVHIKPPPLNTQKIYMKTPKNPNNPQQSFTFRVTPTAYGESTVKSNVGNKLITVKGKGMAQQILSTTSYDNRLIQQQRQVTPNSSPIGLASTQGAKFTIMKPGTVTTSKITKIQNTSSPSAISAAASDSDLLSTSILDIPILFADNDGNIEDGSQIVSDLEEAVMSSPASNANYIVIASQADAKPGLIQTRPVVVNNLTPSNSLTKVTGTAPSSKFVVINRSNLNQLKPATPNLVSTKTMPPLKYSKMVIPTTQITNSTPIAIKSVGTSTTGTLTPGTKIDISSLVKSGTMTTKTSVGSITSTSANKLQSPIIINVDSDKTTFKNVIKIPSSEVPQLKAVNASPQNSIVLKQSELRTMPVIKTGILNRNITVRKINIIRQPTPVTASPTAATTTASEVTSSSTDTTNTL